MTDNDRREFSDLLTGAGELYGRTLSRELRALYWESLKRFDMADIREAFTAHALNADNGQYMPKPADIIRQINGDANGAASLALAKLEKGMSAIGKYKSAVFDDPLIHAAVSLMGGWPKLCSMEPEEWKWSRREFERLYKSLVQRPLLSLNIPPQLSGIAETHNSAHGLSSKVEIGYYGDKGKITAWRTQIESESAKSEVVARLVVNVGKA